ncbi:hypothetical protein theurythT_03150 [Thalassotalea eurytherma]|uniref:Uncharacterized protein n=1 Tax=Thalassotalea eurytherma TaxID=1144278 RepID=A0ABQ6GY40_9GAMM|nr:hypothetical protein theurythT_03150 [Thalassotalea eurytherma]
MFITGFFINKQAIILNKLITLFHRLACQFIKIKSIIIALLVGSFISFFGLLIFAEINTQNVYLVPCLFTFMWALLLMLFIACFVDIDYLNQANGSMYRRVMNQFKRLWAYFVALLTLFLTAAVIYISIKLIGFWL